MAQVTNNTRENLSYPKRGGGLVDVPAGETVPCDLDTDHASVQGAILAGAITVGKAQQAADPASKPRHKPE